MPTLTVTNIDRVTGAVSLYIDDRAGVRALVRTDVNGTRAVRMPATNGLPWSGGDRTFIDHEAALGGIVSYRLDHPSFAELVWVDLSGDWNPRFHVPTMPGLYAEAEVVTAYDAARTTTATFHEVIGREDPLVIEGRLQSRRGTLVTEFATLGGAADLQALLSRGKTVMYRQSEHPGMDLYFHPESLAIAADPERETWTLRIGFVEVAYPLGTLRAEAGQTFAMIRDAYATFGDLPEAYGTFRDLALGESNA